MATLEIRKMKISWVVAAEHRIDPVINLDEIKSVGPIWGSWQTWRACATDNVICHEQQRCRDLLNRAFQAVCNFYVPRSLYENLSRPLGVRLYDGAFDHDMDNIEDIIAMHLAAATSDIVLLLGFDLRIPDPVADRLVQHKLTNRHGLMRSAMVTNGSTQWVAVDTVDLHSSYQTLPNLTCDLLPNVLQLLT